MALSTAPVGGFEGADSDSSTYALTSLNVQLETALSQYNLSTDRQKPALLDELKTVAAARKELLLHLIKTQPDLAIDLALYTINRNKLPAEIRNDVEELVTLQGRLEILISDDFESGRSEERWFIATPDGRYYELFYSGSSVGPVSGDTVWLQGIALGDQVALPGQLPNSLTILSRAASRSLGEKRLAVILINFQNDTSQPWSAATVDNVIFNQTNAYHVENSYGKLTLTGDIFGYYTLPINQTCNTASIANAAIAAADPVVNFLNYTNIIFAGPMSGCGWTGIATIGPTRNSTNDGEIIAGNVWLASMTAAVAGHEFGHNLFLRHANFYDCGTIPIGSNCTSVEYGDRFDIMGTHTNMGHMNAEHKEMAGLLEPSNIMDLSSAGSGTYTISPIEVATTQPQVLKVHRSASSDLTIEYRQSIGYDTAFSSSVLDGAMIHISRLFLSAGDTQLLDMSPGAASSSDVTLEVGQTFTDPGIATITVQSLTSSSLTLDVQVSPPIVDIKVNGLDGPVTYTAPRSFTVSWTSNALSCERSGAWSGSSSGSGSQPFIDVTPAGTYTYTVSCTNGAGTSSDSVVVDLQEPTVPPTVDTKADQHFGGTTLCSILSDGPVNLQAPADIDICYFASYATLGCTQSGSWSGSGVSGSFVTQLGVPAATYTYQVTCSNQVASVSDTVVVYVTDVANQLPIANAGPDQTVTDSDGNGFETVLLNGTGSQDPDGTIVAYEWREDANLLGSSATLSVSFPVATHSVDLVVTDNSGATATDSIMITVNSPGQPQQAFLDDFEAGDPFANWTENNEFDWRTKTATERSVPDHSGSNLVAHADRCSSSQGCILTKTVAVDLSSSQRAALGFWRYVDNDLDSNEYLKVEAFDGTNWNQLFYWTNGQGDDDQWHYESVALPSIYLRPDFKLRFISKESSSSEDTELDDILVVSNPPNQPPLANAGPDQTVTDPDGDGFETVLLNGTGSQDPDGTIVAYEWWEDVNLLGSSATLSVSFPLGTHSVDLVVTDNNGATATDSVMITVAPQPQQIFLDDFETGDPFPNWTESNELDWRTKTATERPVPDHAASNLVAHADRCSTSLGCILTKTVAVDLSSYQTAALGFWRYVDNDLDSGEYLKVEVFNGTSWSQLFYWTNGQGDDDLWHYESVALPSIYLRPDFGLRFTSKESSSSEDTELDDILIEAPP